MVEVSREQFAAYRKVQLEGRFNMSNVEQARQAAGLSKEVYLEILKRFGELKLQYEGTTK